jgi:hypothetical protein
MKTAPETVRSISAEDSHPMGLAARIHPDAPRRMRLHAQLQTPSLYTKARTGAKLSFMFFFSSWWISGLNSLN